MCTVSTDPFPSKASPICALDGRPSTRNARSLRLYIKSFDGPASHRIEFASPEASNGDTRYARCQANPCNDLQRCALGSRHRLCATLDSSAVSIPQRGRGRHHWAGAARFRQSGPVRSPVQRRALPGHRAPKNLRLLAKPSRRAFDRRRAGSGVLAERRSPHGANAPGRPAARERHPTPHRPAPAPWNHAAGLFRRNLRGGLPRDRNSARKPGAIPAVSPRARDGARRAAGPEMLVSWP